MHGLGLDGAHLLIGVDNAARRGPVLLLSRQKWSDVASEPFVALLPVDHYGHVLVRGRELSRLHLLRVLQILVDLDTPRILRTRPA